MADKNITINITDQDESLIAKVDQGQSTSVYSKGQIDNKFSFTNNTMILNSNKDSIYMNNFIKSNDDFQLTIGYGGKSPLIQTSANSTNLFIKSYGSFFNLSAHRSSKYLTITSGDNSYVSGTNNHGWTRDIAFTINEVAISAPAFNNSSLRELKEKIEDYNEDALSLINKLKIVRYDYKGENTPKNMIGVIVDDDTTSDDFKDDSKTAINLYKLNSILIKAFQELSGEVDKIKEQLTTN